MDYCIYETDNDYKANMVIDILKTNKIMSYTKNLGIQNLYGSSKLITGRDLLAGKIKIYIESEDVKKAEKLLKDIPFLKKKIETIENDEIEKEKYIIERALVFSLASIFIIPFFYNLEYLIYFFRKNMKVKYFYLIFNILFLLFSIIFCIGGFEYLKGIWKANIFFTTAFGIGKCIKFHNQNSNLKYLMIVPIIMLIISYIIADKIYGIVLF